jgi:hypothetical protein
MNTIKQVPFDMGLRPRTPPREAIGEVEGEKRERLAIHNSNCCLFDNIHFVEVEHLFKGSIRVGHRYDIEQTFRTAASPLI